MIRVLVPDLPVVDEFVDALRLIDARRWHTVERVALGDDTLLVVER